MQLTCLARCSCLAGQILISKCCLQLRCPWQKKKKKKKDGVSMACHQALFGNFHGCMHSNINSGVIVDGITLSWRHVLLAWSDCQPGSESDCVCVLYTRHTHVTVVVWWCFWLRLFIMTDPWFCSGLHHVAYVPAATHVRTTDAGKVVELSVTRHHTGSLVWLMRKFSVWNFHGSKVYARDKKNWGCHTLPPWCYQVGVLLFFTYHYFTYYLSKIVHHDRP